jgi:hypothetical protein
LRCCKGIPISEELCTVSRHDCNYDESECDVESPHSLYDELYIGELFRSNDHIQRWFVHEGCRASALPEILKKLN